ncbi:unnamed protein product [Closterium sp. Yama58-4]|nr:unnamed protein product [Closterium sp. Yama58-4]
MHACATMLNRKPASLKRAFERRHPQLAGEADSALYASHLLLFALHRALRARTLRTALAASKTVPLDQLLYRSITTFATLHRMHLATQQQRARREASSKSAAGGRGAPPRPPSMGLEQVGAGVAMMGGGSSGGEEVLCAPTPLLLLLPPTLRPSQQQVQAGIGEEESNADKERAAQAEAMALGFTRVAPLLGELATPATAACLHHHLAFTRAANSPSAHPPPTGLSADRMHQFVAAVAHEHAAMSKRTGVAAAALGLQEREVVVAESDATLYIDAPGAPKTLVGHGRLYLTPLALYFQVRPLLPGAPSFSHSTTSLLHLLHLPCAHTPHLTPLSIPTTLLRLPHLQLPPTSLSLQADATGFLRTVAGRVERFDLAAVGAEAAVAAVAPDALALNVFSMTRSLALSSRLQATWTVEFIEYKLQRQRDLWQALLGEVLALHAFLADYRPAPNEVLPAGTHEQEYAEDDDLSDDVSDDDEGEVEDEEEEEEGDEEGKEEGEKASLEVLLLEEGSQQAVWMMVNAVLQLQALQTVIGSTPAHPCRLLPFSWARTVPEGHLVEQALALLLWGPQRLPALRTAKWSAKRLALLLKGGARGDERAGGRGGMVMSPRELFLMSKGGQGSGFGQGGEEEEGERSGRGDAWSGAAGGLRPLGREREELADRAQATVEGSLIDDIPSNVTLLLHLLRPVYSGVRAGVDIIQWKEPLATILAAMLCLFLVNGGYFWLLPALLLLLLAAIIIYYRLTNPSSPPAQPSSLPHGPGSPKSTPSKLTSGSPALASSPAPAASAAAGGRWGRGGGAMRMLVVEMEPSPTTMGAVLMVKDGIAAALTVFQRINVALLKVRSIFQSAEPQSSPVSPSITPPPEHHPSPCASPLHLCITPPPVHHPSPCASPLPLCITPSPHSSQTRLLLLLLLLAGAAAAVVVPLLVPARVIGTVAVLHVFSAYFNFQKQKGGPQTSSVGHKLRRWWQLVPVPPVRVVVAGSAAAAAASTTASGGDKLK